MADQAVLTDGNSHHHKILSSLIVIANVVSVIGAIFVISSIIISICRRRNQQWKRLGAPIFSLSVSNLLLHGVLGSQALYSSIGGQMDQFENTDQDMCQVLFSLEISTAAASCLWTLAIATELNGYLYAAVRQPLSRRYMKYHGPIWTLSLGSLVFLLLRPRKYFFEFVCASPNLVNFIFLDVLSFVIFVLILGVSGRIVHFLAFISLVTPLLVSSAWYFSLICSEIFRLCVKTLPLRSSVLAVHEGAQTATTYMNIHLHSPSRTLFTFMLVHSVS
jgi:hypothetical protein